MTVYKWNKRTKRLELPTVEEKFNDYAREDWYMKYPYPLVVLVLIIISIPIIVFIAWLVNKILG